MAVAVHLKNPPPEMIDDFYRVGVVKFPPEVVLGYNQRKGVLFLSHCRVDKRGNIVWFLFAGTALVAGYRDDFDKFEPLH